MGAVSMVKITETECYIKHKVGIVRTDRVGLFPGFCSENFPFIIS